MVKVFAVFKLFEGDPKVLNIEEEPLKVASTGDYFLIATRTGKIQVYQGAHNTKVHQFSTVNSTIIDLKYWPQNDFIITIEKESPISKINVVRIYSNWRLNAKSMISPICVSPPNSYSSDHTPNLSAANSDEDSDEKPEPNFEVHTITRPNSVNIVSLSAEGTLMAVGTEFNISVWNVTQDMREYLFDIQQSNVKEVAIDNEYIAFSTKTEIFVLQIIIERSLKQTSGEASAGTLIELSKNVISEHVAVLNSKPSRSDSVAENYIKSPPNSMPLYAEKRLPYSCVEDSYFVETFFDTTGKAANAVPYMNLFIESIGNPTRLPSPSISTAEVLGPIKHSLKISLEGGLRLVSSALLLYRRFLAESEIHSLRLIPEYESDMQRQTESNSMLRGLRCFFSTERQGFLYNILNKTHLISSYTYTTDTKCAFADELFLYTLTEEVMGIATMRTIDAYELHLPQPMWIGQWPAANLVQVAITHNHLILLSRTTEADLMRRMSAQINMIHAITPDIHSKLRNTKDDIDGTTVGWKVQVLQMVPIVDLYKEILAKASEYQEVYFQVISEGHSLLLNKLASFENACLHLEQKLEENEFIEAKIQEEQQCRKYLRNSYSLLADYYLNEGNYRLATECYALSDTPVMKVTDKLMSESTATAAITAYLNKVIFDPEMADLIPSNEPFQDTLLSHYARHLPAMLGKVILESSLKKYSLSAALQLLQKIKDRINGDALNEMYLALTLLFLEQKSYNQALQNLTKLPESLLVYQCVTNPKLILPDLHRRDESMLSLGMALRDKAPWALLEILVQLRKTVSISDARKILTSTISEMNVDLKNISYQNCLLEICYFEAILLEMLTELKSNKEKSVFLIKDSNLTKDPVLTDIFLNLTQLYIDMISLKQTDIDQLFLEIYRISEEGKVIPKNDNIIYNINNIINVGKSFESLWKQFHLEVLLNNRCEYLDKLPPYSINQPFMRGRRSDKSTKEHFYMRKLQGLLCLPESQNCNSVLDFVENFLKKINDETFFSLKLLCLPEKDKLGIGLNLLFAKYPELVIDFSKEYCKTVKHWNLVLNIALSQIVNERSELKKKLFSVYEDILTHLSMDMDPEKFLQVLPDEGSIAFFLPYIEGCFHHYKATKLAIDIQEDAAREQTEY